MRFSCNQQALTKALNIVSRAVSSRTTMPILKGILLTTENDQLTLSASDLDISIETTMPVETYEAGKIVVMAKLFGDIIRKLPNDNITIETEGENVIVYCQRSHFDIVSMAPDEFPSIPVPDNAEKTIEFERGTIQDMIRKTTFAASIDEARGVITGVLLEIKDDVLSLVALDGFRMAIARTKGYLNQDGQIIIPAKILNEVNHIIGESADEGENEKIQLLISDNQAIFLVDESRIVLRLLEGEFIQYRNIIQNESRTRVVVNRSDLLNSIERASLLARVGKNNLIRMEMRDGTMEITSKSEEGNNKEEVVIAKEGPDLTIGFNSKYLIDVLKAVDDEEIIMLFNTGTSPCLVQPLEGDAYEYLVLPVRITNV